MGLRKPLKIKTTRNQGYTLVEVVIMMGLLMVLVVAVMILNKVFIDLYRNSLQSVNYGELQAQLASQVANETSCRLMIGGPALKGSTPTGAQVLGSNPATPTDIKLYQVDATAMPSRPLLYDPNTTAKSQYFNWTIQKIQIVPLNITTLDTTGGFMPAKLTLTLVGKTATSNQRQRMLSTLRLAIALDGSRNIVSCRGLTYSDPVIKVKGVVPVCAAGQYFTGSSFKCLPKQ